MTAKKGRFSYIEEPIPQPDLPSPELPIIENLQTVARGQGRMEQDRTQLNIRIPTLLKRRAVAKAALEGQSLAEVIEQMLLVYVCKDINEN